MRAFLSLQVEPSIMGPLKSLSCDIKQQKLTWLRLVDPSQIHLTLKFFAELSDSQANVIGQISESVAKTSKPFTLQLGNMNGFPNLVAPDVVWVSVKDKEKRLNNLKNVLDSALNAIGFSEETRPFKAHFTLARTRNGTGSSDRKHLGEFIRKIRWQEGITFRAWGIRLMHSKLGKSGAVHSPLYSFTLGKGL